MNNTVVYTVAKINLAESIITLEMLRDNLNSVFKH